MTTTQIKKEKTEKVARQALIEKDLIKTVFEKMRTYWSTLMNAFTHINKEKSGYIEEEELVECLENWGFYLTDEQF